MWEYEISTIIFGETKMDETIEKFNLSNKIKKYLDFQILTKPSDPYFYATKKLKILMMKL